MKHFIDFLNAKDVENSPLFAHLKCSKKEAVIIQHLCRKYAKGIEEVSTIELITECFETKGYEHINYLEHIKNILDLGWVVQSSFGQI
ncbi:MAG: AAA family ATPase, partial [Epsilonproteobacteria bacterium]|nr:AAA family ATPase [Campylobacterota bacterium]